MQIQIFKLMLIHNFYLFLHILCPSSPNWNVNPNAQANTNTLTSNTNTLISNTNTLISNTNTNTAISHLFLDTGSVPLLPLPLQDPLKLTNLHRRYKMVFFVTIIITIIIVIIVVIIIFEFFSPSVLQPALRLEAGESEIVSFHKHLKSKRLKEHSKHCPSHFLSQKVAKGKDNLIRPHVHLEDLDFLIGFEQM